MTFEEEAKYLAGAVWRLEKNGFIQPGEMADDEEIAECEHLRRIALNHMENIQTLEREKT